MRALIVGLTTTAVALTSIAAAMPTRPVSPERWVRSVCADVLTWLEDTDESEIQIFEVVDELETGDVEAREARKELVEATRDQVTATGKLIDGVKGAGTPKVDDGKTIARDYLATLGDYEDVYRRANKEYKKSNIKDEDEFADEVTDIEASRLEDLQVIGFDPMEELRDVPDLETPIASEAACGEVDAFLASFAPVAFVVPGDCVKTVTDDLFDLEPTECATSHEGEVFSVIEHPAGLSEPYPGNQAIDAYVEQACIVPFEAYVGIPYAASRLDFVYWTPNEDTWNTGDRQYVCVAQTLDGSPLVGSIMGTAQ